MSPQLQAAVGIVIATLGGLAVGLEREWSGHASGPRARFAGIRTFTLLGLLGGLAGWMTTEGQRVLPAILILGAVGLTVTAYGIAARHHIEGTTEMAALVVLAAAIVAGQHHWAAAGAVFAVTTLLLVEKSRIHSWVYRLDDEELRAAARFAIMAVVILPILPRGPYGPWGGFQPRLLWTYVLFISGLNFLGYITNRAAGETKGYLLTGVLGGFLSSTGVTLSSARLSHSEKSSDALTTGALAACTVVFIRVLLTVTVLNADLARVLAIYLALPAFAGATITLVSLLRRKTAAANRAGAPNNPLQVVTALQMVLLFQAVFYAVYWLQRLFQGAGALASGAIVGLVELDALSISMARKASEIGLDTAARAVIFGLLADAVVKIGLVLFIGKGRFRWSMLAGLACIAAALAASVLIVHQYAGLS